MKVWLLDDREQMDKYASNLVQLCATLAGFSGAFVILVLTGAPSSDVTLKTDLALVCFLVASFGYTVSATSFANLTARPPDIARRLARAGIGLFLGCNIVIWVGFILLVWGTGHRVTVIVSSVLLGIAVLGSSRIPVLLRRLRTKKSSKRRS
jgi:hypothetical protein